jgi:hypothetical protein
MMRRWFLLVSLVLAAGCSPERPPPDATAGTVRTPSREHSAVGGSRDVSSTLEYFSPGELRGTATPGPIPIPLVFEPECADFSSQAAAQAASCAAVAPPRTDSTMMATGSRAKALPGRSIAPY